MRYQRLVVGSLKYYAIIPSMYMLVTRLPLSINPFPYDLISYDMIRLIRLAMHRLVARVSCP